jgi:hypothetical protein
VVTPSLARRRNQRTVSPRRSTNGDFVHLARFGEVSDKGPVMAQLTEALAPRLRQRLLADAQGNPLALPELPVALGSLTPREAR